MISFLRNIFEKQIFGVSAWWSARIGIKTSFIRLFFIYATFTNTITILIYLCMLFSLKLRDYLRYKKRRSVFDL